MTIDEARKNVGKRVVFTASHGAQEYGEIVMGRGAVGARALRRLPHREVHLTEDVGAGGVSKGSHTSGPKPYGELPKVSSRPGAGGVKFTGSNSERQSVGAPGHCERCAEVGHVAAHPELGCSDVGCDFAHGPDDEEFEKPSAQAPPLTSRAAIGDLIAEVQNAVWNGQEEADRVAAEATERIADAIGPFRWNYGLSSRSCGLIAD